MHKRLCAAFALSFCLSLGLQAALAGSASIDQSGTYTYTVVRQNGHKTKTKTRQIDEARYDQLNEKLAMKVERINERGGLGRCRTGSGPANRGSVNQDGYSNQASISQYGTNNSATIDQPGSDNIAYTVQLGSNHQAQTTQDGDHNIAFILQRCR